MKRPWMPLYVGDYLADTGHLTAQEHGAYLLLLMHQWTHGSIPNNPEILTRIARVHPPHWPRTWKALSQFFHDQEGGVLIQKRLAAEISKAAEISNKRKEAALQMHSKCSAKAHTTTTTATNKKESKNPPTPQRGARRKSRTPIPDAWTKQLPLEAYLDGIQREVVEREFPRFVASALAHGRQYADWLSAWRNWLSSPYQQSNVLDLRTRKQEESDRVLAALKQSIRRDEEASQAVCSAPARLLPAPGRE